MPSKQPQAELRVAASIYMQAAENASGSEMARIALHEYAAAACREANDNNKPSYVLRIWKDGMFEQVTVSVKLQIKEVVKLYE